MALEPPGRNAEGGRGVDHRCLQHADVPAQVERVAELDDRVGHDLPGSVERDVPAAVDADQLRPDLSQPLGAREHVRV
jgi:hypothetical protein